MDNILAAMETVKVIRVTAVLSIQAVQPWREINSASIQTCLWPRVTVEVMGKQKTFPMKNLLEAIGTKKGPGPNIWEEKILGLCGGNKKSPVSGRRRTALERASGELRDKVNRAIWRAAQTNKVREKVEVAWRRKVREKFRKAFSDWLKLDTIKPLAEVMRDQDVLEAFKDHRKMETVTYVLET